MYKFENPRVQMGYLVDFEKAIENHDAPAMMRLWEEYTSTDEVDGEDFRNILEVVKASKLSDFIGRHIERSLPLWEKIEPGPLKDDILRLMVDLQTMNNPTLWDHTITYLQEKFGDDPKFSEKMRLIGLRGGSPDFRGAISNFLLLNHMKKGNFVFHTSGWGVGEILEVSMLREQLSLEFDYAPGHKEVPFKIAFQTLIPLSKNHFLAQRFGNPDALEEFAKSNPVETIRLLLKDLGPKTASEIKEELYELVIPEEDWNRWWQTARSKVKKDTQIESPSSQKEPFRVLKSEVSHEERLQKALEEKPEPDTFISMLYSFFKDFPETAKNSAFRESIVKKLRETLSASDLSLAQELQLHYFLQDLTSQKDYAPVAEILKKCDSIPNLLGHISIQVFKKRTIAETKKHIENWEKIYLNLLFPIDQTPLRDFILDQLLQAKAIEAVEEKLQELFATPQKYPEATIWYLQKVMESKSSLPFSDARGRAQVFEAFLIALSHLEQEGEKRDLIKKMHGILSAKRYELVRKVLKDASKEEVQEFLLLISKCHSLTDHDIKLFHSLAEVAHPSLKNQTPAAEPDEDVIWTTKQGYTILQKRIEHIGTVETVENAKEIEVARSHGDLRENAEFKAALERRDRLQAELKFLSDQLNKCRILTKEDVDITKVGVGTSIEFESESGEKITYTLLGPWDANPEKNILSFQSKLAKSLAGLEVGDTVEVQGKQLTISDIRSAI